MTSSTIDEKQKEAGLSEIKRIAASLDALSVIALAHELYTRQARVRLLAEHKSLIDADLQAYRLMKDAAVHDDLEWNERVKRFGAEVAKEQFAPQKAAGEAKLRAGKAIDAFEREHPIIGRLADAAAANGRSTAV